MFALEGARVVGCDIQPGAAERIAAALRDKGCDVTGHSLDLWRHVIHVELDIVFHTTQGAEHGIRANAISRGLLGLGRVDLGH